MGSLVRAQEREHKAAVAAFFYAINLLILEEFGWTSLFLVSMFCVYIIFSEKLNKFYIGTTDDFDKRLKQHNSSEFLDAFTSKGIPWAKFIVIENLSSKTAYLIEKHIKSMKSKNYILNLPKYPDIIINLIEKYS